MISEATYKTSEFVEKIYPRIKEFIKLYPESGRGRTINISPFIDWTGTAFLNLKFGDKNILEARTSRTGNPIIFLKIPKSYKIRTDVGMIKKVLDHELVHVLDKIRSGKEEIKTPIKYERGKKTGSGYFREPSEFNAVIHEIKQIAKRKKVKYNNISSKQEFIDFFKNENLYLLNRFAEVVQEPAWYKKLITRLNREGLVPENLDLNEVEFLGDFEKYLEEETYNIDNIVKTIKKEVVDYIKNEKPSKKIVHLTQLFMPFIKKYWPDLKNNKIFLRIGPSHLSNNRTISGFFGQDFDGGPYFIDIALNKIWHKELGPEKMFKIESLLNHEITHVIDTLRAKGKRRKFPKKYFKTPGGYFRHEGEVNALIHQIKKFKEKKPAKFYKIKNKEDFIEFLKLFPDTKVVQKNLENESFYKKIVRRLNRESMLPKLMREEYLDTFILHGRGRTAGIGKRKAIEVFKNPSKKEMEQVAENKVLRFLAYHPTKTLYVFIPDSEHWEVAGKVGISKYMEDRVDVIGGVARKTLGTWVCDEAHNIDWLEDIKDMKDFLAYNWDWLNKYNLNVDIVVSKVAKKVKKRTYKIEVKEEFVDTIVYPGGTRSTAKKKEIDVFKNPSPKEMKEVAEDNTLRYIAYHPTKTLYVFMPGVFHFHIFDRLFPQAKGTYFTTPNLIGGVAQKVKGKWVSTSAHSLTFARVSGKAKEITRKNWDWVNKYIDINSALKVAKKIAGQRKEDDEIDEEYLDTFKIKASWARKKPSTVDVFKNPTRKEMDEVAGNDKVLRFFAHYPTKTFYIFDSEYIHQEVASSLGFRDIYSSPKINILGGVARKKGNVWDIEFIDNLEISKFREDEENKKRIADFYNKNWSWVGKYVNIDSYIQRLKKEDEEVEKLRYVYIKKS